jgi:hypothetical protein
MYQYLKLCQFLPAPGFPRLDSLTLIRPHSLRPGGPVWVYFFFILKKKASMISCSTHNLHTVPAVCFGHVPVDLKYIFYRVDKYQTFFGLATSI